MNAADFDYCELGKKFLDRGIDLNWEGGGNTVFCIDEQELRRRVVRNSEGMIRPNVGYGNQIAVVETEKGELPRSFSMQSCNSEKVIQFYRLPSGVNGLHLPRDAKNYTGGANRSIKRVAREVYDHELAELPLKYLEWDDRTKRSMKERLDPGNAPFTMIDEKHKNRFSEMEPNQQRMLLVLARETIGRYDEEEDRRKKWTEMSYSELADKTGTSKSTVQRCVTEMQEQGWIEKEGVERSKLKYRLN